MIECFGSIANILSQHNEFSPLVKQARERVTELQNNKFTVMVVGEFKRGKTTLLNAMLGARAMPTKLTPCTAIVTYIRYGQKPEAEIIFHGNRKSERLSIEAYVNKYQLNVDDTKINDTQAVSQEITDRFGEVDHAVIYYPSKFLENGVEIVDTPGINEHDIRTQRVLEKLRQADAIIMVLDAITVCNQNEASFIEDSLRPYKLNKYVFFLINRWNLVSNSLIDPNDPEELENTLVEQVKFIKSKLVPFVSVAGKDKIDKRIFKVNALGALQCRLKGINDPNNFILKETEIPAFEYELSEFLVSERDKARRDKDLSIAERIENEINSNISSAIRKINEPIPNLKAEENKLNYNIDQLNRIKTYIGGIFSRKTLETSDDLSNSLETYLDQNLFSELEQHVSKFNMGPLEKIRTQYNMLFCDFMRSEEEKVRTKIEVNIKTQVSELIGSKFKDWQSNYSELILNAQIKELQEEIKIETKEYIKVLSEIKEGANANRKINDEEITQKIHGWLIIDSLKYSATSGLAIDLSPLIAGIMGDILLNLMGLAMHVALPLIGTIISVIFSFMRKEANLNKVRSKIVESIRDKRKELLLDTKVRIQKNIEESFNGMSETIAQSIDSEISIIKASISDVLKKRQKADFDAKKFEAELTTLQSKVKNKMAEIRQLAA